MWVQNLPSRHLGVAGHGHPSPSKFIDDTQRLQDLLAGLVFDIDLRGMAASSAASLATMHFPRLRQSPSKEHAISHLDVVSCWKGISNAQALELTLWERLFQHCLKMQIEDCLRLAVVTQLSSSGELVDKTTLLPRIIQCLPDPHVRSVAIDVEKLIRDMIETFYADHTSEVAARNFRWSLGSQDLSSFVYNFLFTQDCFTHAVAGPLLCIEFSCYLYTDPVLTILADVIWQSPDIRFGHLPEQLGSGERYSIAPYHVVPSMGLDDSNYVTFPTSVNYTVKLSSSPITWDPEGDCFRAQAPDAMDKETQQSTAAETVICARIVTTFSDSVRFDRVSRYLIKIEVADNPHVAAAKGHDFQQPGTQMAPWVSSHTTTPLSKIRHSTTRFIPAIGDRAREKMPRHNSLFDDEEADYPNTEPQSPNKRKASQPQASPSKKRRDSEGYLEALSLDGARQPASLPSQYSCPEATEPADNHAITGNKSMIAALEIALDWAKGSQAKKPKVLKPSGQKLPHRRIDSECKAVVPVTRAHPLGTKFAFIMERMRAERNASGKKLPSPSTSYDSSDASDLEVSISSQAGSNNSDDSEQLQRQIQDNYREFEDQAKRKAAGECCETSENRAPGVRGDTADVDFESVFLEDSEAEGWSWMSEGMKSPDSVD
ncbi:hypothetical protein EJ02DRAFT_46480 [Clathrospora elynae]|uniref:Uncharacterized protein n=1 Tax=Clathrospora elynae TaxID=706981 RepID=A0A6A5T440_9PLEO|nr:hypothetical protein EJ02DRAFT_46480 [Clathrospora elynae]